ncbi:MAG: HesB/IscA family protein [Candidatus Hodarchaeales archaeon]|jgi:iron-sulfur cluster assembly accessory protein
MSQQETNLPINITPYALSRIKTVIDSKEEKTAMFRVDVAPSGCSGLTYAFKLDNISNEDDYILNFDNVKVVIANSVLADMRGSTIDFEESLLSSQFVVNNPLAIKTCNCGISFQTASNKGRIEKC